MAFLLLAAAGALAAQCTEPCDNPPVHPFNGPVLASWFDPPTAGFKHGVASGDPLPERVVIWTRYTPIYRNEEVSIRYVMASRRSLDPRSVEDLLTSPLNLGRKSGTVVATAASDWTVKIDVDGLDPGTDYVFRFSVVGQPSTHSAFGYTKTAPAPGDAVAELNYAVFSCSTRMLGYFHAYATAASMANLDFWVHVGDYIYEYGGEDNPYAKLDPDTGRYVSPVRVDGPAPNWQHEQPDHECVALQDYRTRYAQYHTDEGLQALRRRAPLVAAWDDHEIANDSYKDGAENHQPATEGSWADRKAAATKAYLEWMPIRKGLEPAKHNHIDRIFEWGRLATLALTESRVSERTATPGKLNFIEGNPFIPAVETYTNMDEYADLSTAAGKALAAIAQTVAAQRAAPANVIMGPGQVSDVSAAFAKSKAAGKPWQIMTTGTVMGYSVAPSFRDLPKTLGPLEGVLGPLLPVAAFEADPTYGPLIRLVAAMKATNTPFNDDAWDGYTVERKQLLDIFASEANNAVVLSGDSHDSWAFVLNAENTGEGTPVAVNLCTPGVTNYGFASGVPALWDVEVIPGLKLGSLGWFLINGIFTIDNPSLKHFSLKDTGFIAVKATPTSHTADYIYNNVGPDAAHSSRDSVLSQPYAAGGGTPSPPPYFCGKSLETDAAVPGSLSSRTICKSRFGVYPSGWLDPSEAPPGFFDSAVEFFAALLARSIGSQLAQPAGLWAAVGALIASVPGALLGGLPCQ